MKNDLGKAQGPQSLFESELLTPKEAAAFLRMSESYLAKARMRGDGPRYRKLSRSVRYTKTDLLIWLRASAKTSTCQGDWSADHEDAGTSIKNVER